MLTDVQKIRQTLEGLKTALEETVPPMMMRLETEPTVADNLDAYFELKQLSEVADEIRKVFSHVQAPLAERIKTLMCAIGESLDREYNGRTYRVKPDLKMHVSVTKENERRAIDWFKADECGKEMVRESVHPKTMESFINQKMQDGVAVPSDIFNVYLESTLSIRALPKKKE